MSTLSASLERPVPVRTGCPASVHALTTREVFVHQCRREERLRVLHGRLWVTVEGRSEDFVLEPGRCLILPARAKSVIEALEVSSFELTGIETAR